MRTAECHDSAPSMRQSGESVIFPADTGSNEIGATGMVGGASSSAWATVNGGVINSIAVKETFAGAVASISSRRPIFCAPAGAVKSASKSAQSAGAATVAPGHLALRHETVFTF